MKNSLLLCLSLILLFPIVHANALTGNAELVLENIQIEPPFPKKGELTKIVGYVYNAGIVETDSLASIVTVAYFIDDKLLSLDELGNVEPGLSKKIKISSDLIWDAEIGIHMMKVVVDYHDTLNDVYDSSDNNTVEQSITVEQSETESYSKNDDQNLPLDPSLDIDLIPNEFSINPKIPNWIRNNAAWWADGQIDDVSFVDGLQFLIKENILQIPISQINTTSTSTEIPNWIRNNAAWWADGQIDDVSFINVIQYLIDEEIINDL